MNLRADIYIAHNIETLVPTIRAAKTNKAKVAFDCMEYYADMGDSQTPLERSAAHKLQRETLANCALVLASSDIMADVLAEDYQIARPLVAYNVPAIERVVERQVDDKLWLYWRNAVVGFGQRGLDDILQALPRLPGKFRLAIQGRLAFDGGLRLNERIAELGVADRIRIFPPYGPGQAVKMACSFDVGLCLERRGPRNQEITVSSKMFDYHMAGLAVVSSNLPALSAVLERSGGGLTYAAGSIDSLVETLCRLAEDPALLAQKRRNAREFALKAANLETELQRIVAAFRRSLSA